MDGSLTALAERYEGKCLNSPNDLVYRSDGLLYFTDQPAGLWGKDADPRKELSYNGVFLSYEGNLNW
jgi:gluconolactonase